MAMVEDNYKKKYKKSFYWCFLFSFVKKICIVKNLWRKNVFVLFLFFLSKEKKVSIGKEMCLLCKCRVNIG